MTRARAMQWCVELVEYHSYVSSVPGRGPCYGVHVHHEGLPGSQIVSREINLNSPRLCPFFDRARQVFFEC